MRPARLLLTGCLLLTLVTIVTASAASLDVDGGVIQVFAPPVPTPVGGAEPTPTPTATPDDPGDPGGEGTPTPTPVPQPIDVAAELAIHPEVLQLDSQGEPVTAKLRLPRGCSTAELDLTRVTLVLADAPAAGRVPADPHPASDHGTLKFERAAVATLLSGRTGEVRLIVTGTAGHCHFTGSDDVRVR